ASPDAKRPPPKRTPHDPVRERDFAPLTQLEPTLSNAGRATTMSAAHSTIGTARLNRLLNPVLGDDRRAPSAQPVKSLPIGASEALNAPSSGEPLEAGVRRQVESTLGVELGHVRVHNDPQAAAAAQSLSARAFTYGNHIFLGPGQNAADTRLIA